MITNHFNKLSESETERLALLIEECSEVSHIASKILRHGYASSHPDYKRGRLNRHLLEDELGDLAAIVELMLARHDVSDDQIAAATRYRLQKSAYLHHNTMKDLTDGT